MMLSIFQVILAVVLFFVIYQDLNKRTIHAILPLLIFIITMVINYYTSNLYLFNVLNNFLFILVNIAGLILYNSIKSRKIINPINKTLGAGDILFFLAMTPLFTLRSFILFFILGLLFSLIVHGIYSIFKDVKTIPLAGYLALFLVINMVLQVISSKNLLL